MGSVGRCSPPRQHALSLFDNCFLACFALPPRAHRTHVSWVSEQALLFFEPQNDLAMSIKRRIDAWFRQSRKCQGFKSGTHSILHRLIEDQRLWSDRLKLQIIFSL